MPFDILEVAQRQQVRLAVWTSNRLYVAESANETLRGQPERAFKSAGQRLPRARIGLPGE